MRVLMVGVSSKRVGGMQAVAEQYMHDQVFNSHVQLTYVATSTNGSAITRLFCMIKGYIKILYLLNAKPFDLVHIHMAEKGSTYRKGIIAKWAKKKGKKVIIHLHAGPFMAWYDTQSDKNKKRIKSYFSYSDIVFALGEYWKKELTEIIPETKITVLYNGISCEKTNPYNLNSHNIVYFGVMNKAKGTYDLINAVKRVSGSLPRGTKIVLCGNDLVGDIEERICKLGLADYFSLPGWVSGEEKEIIYKDAMISVLPSYYEGLSMTVLEAMARGVPVITTNISTMPEVLGGISSLVEPGDVVALSEAILTLSHNRDEREKISEQEFNRVSELFSQEKFINKTLEQYNMLLNRNEPSC